MEMYTCILIQHFLVVLLILVSNCRFLLLVEDGHGAVCEIQISNKTLEDVGVRPDLMEGKSYQFTGFHVHCRKTRDK